MNQYRKKPVVVEAIQLTVDNFQVVENFIGVGENTHRHYNNEVDYLNHKNPSGLHIKTLEGLMIGSVGDYIIKGVKGEFYPCKPDIFEATYDSVPKNHIDRMEVEASELQAKIDGVKKFLDSIEYGNGPMLCDEQFDLIEKQLEFMEAYLITLRSRIDFDKEMFNAIGVKD